MPKENSEHTAEKPQRISQIPTQRRQRSQIPFITEKTRRAKQQTRKTATSIRKMHQQL